MTAKNYNPEVVEAMAEALRNIREHARNPTEFASRGWIGATADAALAAYGEAATQDDDIDDDQSCAPGGPEWQRGFQAGREQGRREVATPAGGGDAWRIIADQREALRQIVRQTEKMAHDSCEDCYGAACIANGALARSEPHEAGLLDTPADPGALPELPTPHGPWHAESDDEGYYTYTADQMLAYGQQCHLAPTGSAPAPSGDDREIIRWLNGDVLLVLLDVANGIDSPGLASMARGGIRRIEAIVDRLRAAPTQEPQAPHWGNLPDDFDQPTQDQASEGGEP